MTTQVATAPVIAQVVRDAFNFSVDKFPLSGPDNLRTDWYGLFRSDTNAPVGSGSVSKIYVPHETDDILALTDAALEAFDGELTAKCHFREGHYVELTPTKDYRRNIFGTLDNIFPRVMIHAGYDGKAFKASVGYWRDLCKNMHIMRQVSGTTVAIRHTSGLRSRMAELVVAFSQLKTSWNALGNTVARLSDETVDMTQFLTAIYGEPEKDTGRSATMHVNRTKAIFRRLMRERTTLGKGSLSADFRVSAWDAFNAVQGYVQHDSIRKGGVGDFERMLLANDDTAVRTAESLVMQLVA
jgi:hypothetical protein